MLDKVYLTEIISYKNVWDNHSRELMPIISDMAISIQRVTELLDQNSHESLLRNEEVWKPSPKLWETTLNDTDYHNSLNSDYHTKDDLYYILNPLREGTLFDWIFTELDHLFLAKYGGIPIAIATNFDRYFDLTSTHIGDQFHNSDMIIRQLEVLGMLTTKQPFIIICFSTISSHLKIHEIPQFDLYDLPDQMTRSIQFPPELFEAGRNILSYFGTYLSETKSDLNAKVTIQQDEKKKKLRLIVESETGYKEVIEKAYEEYTSIISGKEPPEKFTTKDKLILGLRSELRYAWARVEDFKDAKLVAEGNLEDMKKLLGQSLQQPQNISINNQIKAEASASTTVSISQNFSMALSSFSELKELLPNDSSEHRALNEIQKRISELKQSNDRDVVSTAPVMNKFRRMLEKVRSGQGAIADAVKTAEDGYDIFNDLAKQYNAIADWCGLPQVPKVLLKK